MACGASGNAVAAAPLKGVIVTRNAGILEIVSHADPIVKAVMLLLLVASVATWALWFMKLTELKQARNALNSDMAVLAPARSLAAAEAAVYPATKEMLRMAQIELAEAGPTPSRRAIAGVEERFSVQMPIIEARATHRVLRGSNVIASIGATAPFVGLAGTVWGIMNSFLGIANAKSTSLAVVAPGIAEALFATALGLAVAIPAVLIYNNLARSIAGYRRQLNEVAVLAACVLSRELEQHDVAAGGGQAAVASRWPATAAAAQSGASASLGQSSVNAQGR
jgi:biopolymer transport protein ExbB